MPNFSFIDDAFLYLQTGHSQRRLGTQAAQLVKNELGLPWGYDPARSIIGSQTKPYHPPKVGWVHAIIKCADKAGKAVFIKDNLKPLLGNNLRQEFCSLPKMLYAELEAKHFKKMP